MIRITKWDNGQVHGQDSSEDPQFYTYGNSRNSFTADNMFNQHERIDFIFFRSGPNIQVGKTEEPFIKALNSCDVRNWY